MRKPSPLPLSLQHSAFSVAQARRVGLSNGRLRRHDLATPFTGVRSTGGPITSVEELCRAYLPRLRADQYFSHLTAARLWALPLPRPFSADEPLHISSPTRGARLRTHGVTFHEQGDVMATRTVRFGLPVSDAVTTWCTLASCLGIDDLVAAADGALWVERAHPVYNPHPRPLVHSNELNGYAEHFGRRGRRALLAAAALSRVGTASPTETRLRLLIRRAGLPEPELNVEMHDEHGRSLGWGDLVYRRPRVLVEYDGDQHRTDTTQYERDQTRIARLYDAGWSVIRVRKKGLFRAPAQTTEHIRRTLTARGYAPKPPTDASRASLLA